MGIRVSALLKQEAETEIVYFDEKGVVKFRPGVITDDMFERVQEAAETDDQNVLNQMLTEVCISWDVLDDAGTPIPFLVKGEKGEKGEMVVNPELARLPIPFKSAVLEQVIEAARGNSKPSAASSRGGSRRNRR